MANAAASSLGAATKTLMPADQLESSRGSVVGEGLSRCLISILPSMVVWTASLLLPGIPRTPHRNRVLHGGRSPSSKRTRRVAAPARAAASFSTGITLPNLSL